MNRLLLCIFLAPILLYAQGLEIFGYYEPQVNLLRVDNQTYNLASNKLRLDFTKDLSDHVRFGANVNYVTYHGKTQWNVLDYLPDSITGAIPPQARELYIFQFGDMVQASGPSFQFRPDRIFLDNAYVRLSFDWMDLTIGRQQISLGTGYTWNPTDFFDTKDILDPTYEQPGHNAVRANIPLGNGFGFDLLWAPGYQWKDSAKMLKFRGRVGHFDWAVIGLQRDWRFTNYDPRSFAEHGYVRTLIGGEFAGELLGLGVWSEGGTNFLNLESGTGLPAVDDFWEWVIGVDYTFQTGLYVMTEFYHNSMAASNWRKYTLNDWMWMLTTESKSMTRDQMFVMLQYPATDLLTIGAMGIHSISDGSTAIVPMLLYSLFQDVELTVYGNAYLGKEGRAFSGNLGNGALARLRVYF